jgi:hypothetical protein
LIEIIKTDGTREPFHSENAYPTLDEIQAAVGGDVQMVPMEDGKEIWCNEEGKIIGLPVNHLATKIWIQSYGATDVIVGNILYCDAGDIK